MESSQWRAIQNVQYKMAAEWRELCLSREVEELILARLRDSELSGNMLAGVQRELVTRRESGTGCVGEVANDFIKKSGGL